MENSVRLHALNYRKLMADDGRIIQITDGENKAVIVFSLTNDPEKLLEKGQWDFVKSENFGRFFFIEKMITTKWTPKLRRKVQEVIQKNFTNFEKAMWVRSKLNKEIIIKVKRRDHGNRVFV